MALITCPECKKKISDTAGNCPNCGNYITRVKIAEMHRREQEAQKGCGRGCLLVVGIMFAFCLVALIASLVIAPKPKTEEQLRTERIQQAFSPIDGSHRGLEEHIKKAMNDPDSYKHDETAFVDKGDYLIVKTTFRGKNAFGGVVKNTITAKVDLDGRVLEIIDSGN